MSYHKRQQKQLQKGKNRNRTTNTQPVRKQKFREKWKLVEVNYHYWKERQKE